MGIIAAIAVVGTLVAGALHPPLRWPVLVALVALAALAGRVAPARWAALAGLPVAVLLAWNTLVADRLAVASVACADPLSPLAWSRAAQASLVFMVILGLARLGGTSLADLGLRRPSRTEARWALVVLLAVPLPSLVVGAILAGPFFGELRLDLAQPIAVVPALVLAVANGSMEELVYRGALLHWLSRAAGPAIALVGQAVVFGAAHTGPDFVGPALPVVLAVAAAGLVAGLIVRRTGSLVFVIAAHIAFDVPLYYAAACRLG